MLRKRILTVLFLISGLMACGQPVPPDKADYVGLWTGPHMALLITRDGSVKYKRLKGAATTSLEGKIRKFEGNNFSVGVSFLSTTFVVSKPPYRDGGVWKMVVDDVPLTKAQQPAHPQGGRVGSGMPL